MNPQRSISKEKSRGRLSAPACAALTDCLPASDVVPHADDAVTDEHETGVVDVAAEGGGVAEDRAVFDRQRPGRAVEDTAAIGAGRGGGERTAADCQRREKVVQDPAPEPPGGGAGEGATADRGLGRGLDGNAAAALGREVAGDGATGERQLPEATDAAAFAEAFA